MCLLNRNKNNANLSLFSTSPLKNLKQHTKQLNSTSDIQGGARFSVWLSKFMSNMENGRQQAWLLQPMEVFVTLNPSASTADSVWHESSITWLVSVQRDVKH